MSRLTILGVPKPIVKVAATQPSVLRISAPGPQGQRGASGGLWRTYVFSQPSLVWLINHGFLTRRFVVTVRDEQGVVQLLSPRILDENSFSLEFTEPMTGSVDVLFEGV